MGYHTHFTIANAINWSDEELTGFFKNDETGELLTADQARDFLSGLLAQGKVVFPCSTCDNFDYKTGCMGHSKQSTNNHRRVSIQGNINRFFICIKCFVIGHKPDAYSDEYYHQCLRCRAQETDPISFAESLTRWYLTIPSIWKNRRIWLRSFQGEMEYRVKRHLLLKCTDCGKIKSMFGRAIGNHKDCLPF